MLENDVFDEYPKKIEKKLLSWFNKIGIENTENEQKSERIYIFDRNKARIFFENYKMDISENYTPSKLIELNRIISNIFLKEGYKIQDSISILHKNAKKGENVEETIFTVAGIQVIDNILFNPYYTPPKEKQKLFVSQPCIRMSSLNNVGLKRGFFSSFINVTSIIINPTIEDYLNDIGLWLKYLTSYIDPSTIRLGLSHRKISWSGKTSYTFRISFYSNDFELGDSAFHYAFNKSEKDRVMFIDSGFGLERIALTIYKNLSDLEIIGPAYYKNKKFEIVDRTRTLTLLIGSNVLPDNSAAGTKVKHLIRDLIYAGEDYTWYNLIPYFYAFWSEFAGKNLIVGPSSIRLNLRDEYYRLKNKDIADKLGLNIPSQDLNIPTYEFLDRCIAGIYGKSIKRKMVYKIISELDSV